MDILNDASKLNSSTFPTKNNLNLALYEYNFNKMLVIIRCKIVEANNRNEQYIRVMNPDLNMFNIKIVDDVKKFLSQKEYNISNIENENNILLGWKLSWE